MVQALPILGQPAASVQQSDDVFYDPALGSTTNVAMLLGGRNKLLNQGPFVIHEIGRVTQLAAVGRGTIFWVTHHKYWLGQIKYV